MTTAAFATPLVKTPQHPVYRQLLVQLREMREQKKVTQADLAKLLRQPQSYVAKIEAGERRLDVLEFVYYVKALGEDPASVVTKMSDQLGSIRRTRVRLTQVLDE